MTSPETKRPFGFVLIRYYASESQVPEMVLNPEHIANCYSAKQLFDHRPTVFVELRDGTKLKLWTYNKDLQTIIAEIDTAMRERLSLGVKLSAEKGCRA